MKEASEKAIRPNMNVSPSELNGEALSGRATTGTGDEMISRAVWITRLADDHLSSSYSTQELLHAGHDLSGALDIQARELVKKYVAEKQILAVAGTLDIASLSLEVKNILLRLASANIDSCKNKNNSYSLMTFSRVNDVSGELNLRNKDNLINNYKDLRQAMLNEWHKIKQEFYTLKS
ncbi:hypothetical protein CR532_04655 (plasmid) [Candidatus Borreliella tachyglossi]|uniref:Uncharacterized protein n=1 Tax=Candidatus Borreliella tachyglossi TaxID=1964448 RepID=A0A2S1LYD8_9SPIR|nr:DUF1357 family protein [Candidatus Borreliella tachyglossi]AWG43291.1 hypothetical protein CR532_04655 [Candidatus Borreliella tachyglossi]